jgi:hypothetical protein
VGRRDNRCQNYGQQHCPVTCKLCTPTTAAPTKEPVLCEDLQDGFEVRGRPRTCAWVGQLEKRCSKWGKDTCPVTCDLLTGTEVCITPDPISASPTASPSAPIDPWENGAHWAGWTEVGQSHIVRTSGETRIAPKVVAEREAELLFTPESQLPDSEADVRLRAYSGTGQLLGVLKVRSPSQVRGTMEQALTTEAIAPYSQDAWSATLPWDWVKTGTVVKIAVLDSTSGLMVHTLVLSDLTSWSVHTISRVKCAMFGSEGDVGDLDTYTHSASKVARDFHSATTMAELRWVDSELWHLPYLVVGTSTGAVKVESEGERRLAMMDASDEPGTEPPWNILKVPFPPRPCPSCRWGEAGHRNL